MIGAFPSIPAKLVMITLHMMAYSGFLPACQPQCVHWDCLHDVIAMPKLAPQLNVQLYCR